MPAFDRCFSAYNPDAAAPRTAVTERWITGIGGPAARPVISSGTVLVPTVESLSALDPDTGERRWEFTPDGDVTGMAAAGSVAFLGVGSMVYGLDGSASE